MDKAVQILKDQIVFLMPRDRELLFPAMSVLASYVNEYAQRMYNYDVSQGRVIYQLEYNAVVNQEHWAMFMGMGLQLSQLPTEIALSNAAMVVDWRDENLKRYIQSGKHAAQVCGVLCGVGARTFPSLTQVRPLANPSRWAMLPEYTVDSIDLPLLTTYEALYIKDDEYTGFVGHASWLTYLMAARGMPVVEIIPEDRPLEWLSKWTNPMYRAVDGPAQFHGTRIRAAMRSVEEDLSRVPIRGVIANK